MTSNPTKRVGNKDFRVTLGIVIGVAVIAIGAGVYLTITAPEDDGSYIPGSQEITPEIELLRGYVMIDTTSGREELGAQYLSEYFEDRGVAHELIETGPGKAAVYARLEASVESDEGLMLLSHIDVVPANPDEWEYGPFDGEIALNRLWGRGVLDMKGTTITQMIAFADLATEGAELAHDLVFLAAPDEERGGEEGVKWLIENRPDLFEGVGYVINEGGLTETIRDQLVLFSLEIGSKNIVQLRAFAQEREPLEQLRDGLVAWKIEPKIERLLPGVDAYFRTVAPRRVLGGEILRDVRKAEGEGRLDELGSNYLELMQDFAIVPEEIEDVEGGYSLRFYLSLLPDRGPEEALRRVEEMTPRGVAVAVESRYMAEATPLSEIDTELFRIIAEHVSRIWGDEVVTGPVVTFRTTTDCRYLRPRGMQCYGLWPFQVTMFESQGIHRADERLRLDWFVEGIELMRGIVREYVVR